MWLLDHIMLISIQVPYNKVDLATLSHNTKYISNKLYALNKTNSGLFVNNKFIRTSITLQAKRKFYGSSHFNLPFDNIAYKDEKLNALLSENYNYDKQLVLFKPEQVDNYSEKLITYYKNLKWIKDKSIRDEQLKKALDFDKQVQDNNISYEKSYHDLMNKLSNHNNDKIVKNDYIDTTNNVLFTNDVTILSQFWDIYKDSISQVFFYYKLIAFLFVYSFLVYLFQIK